MKYWYDIKAAICIEAENQKEANEKAQFISEWYDIDVEEISKPRTERYKK